MSMIETDAKQYILDNISAIEFTNLVLHTIPDMNDDLELIDGKIKIHFKPNTIKLA